MNKSLIAIVPAIVMRTAHAAEGAPDSYSLEAPAVAAAEGAIAHDLLCNPHYVVFSAIWAS